MNRLDFTCVLVSVVAALSLSACAKGATLGEIDRDGEGGDNASDGAHSKPSSSDSTASSSSAASGSSAGSTGGGSVCGDDACDPGETCTTCPSDCGICSTCGDNICDLSECQSCATDCAPHDKCQTGAKLDPQCDPCVNTVCTANPACCTSAWDEVCVGVASLQCGLSCGPTCGDAMCDAGETCMSCPADCGACAGSCTHDKCDQGGALDPSCDPCVDFICFFDVFCCSSTWDEICVSYVGDICFETCP